VITRSPRRVHLLAGKAGHRRIAAHDRLAFGVRRNGVDVGKTLRRPIGG